MQVAKIMTKNPACCTPDSTLQEVAHMMEMYDCGCIPVISDHQSKRPIGTITDRDITVRTFSANKNPLEMKASDIMTKDITTVTPETSVEDCMNTMENKQIRRVLVEDKSGRCIGIVAQADLAEHAAHPARTADFIREVSESDQPREKGFYSERSQITGSVTPRRNNRSFEQNESRELHRPSPAAHRKSHEKKESFFNSTTLLALLGSIGLGAGLRYYLGPEKENKHHPAAARKIKTYNVDTNAATDRKSTGSSTATGAINSSTGIKSTDSTIGSPTQKSAPAVPPLMNKTETRDTFGSGIDSFNQTNDDPDLKPITEVGRTATNT